MKTQHTAHLFPALFAALSLGSFAPALAGDATPKPQAAPAQTPTPAKKPDFPPFDQVVEGLEKVVSTADGRAPLYDLYANEKEAKLLAVLPANCEKQLQMMACTVSGGDPEAGVMGPTHYIKWRRIGKQMAIVEPRIDVRTDDDKQAKESIEELYTDRVITSVPIVALAPGNRPVIDFGAMATQKATQFFPRFQGYGPGLAAFDARLATLTKAKAFPQNIIVEYEAPAAGGRLTRITYNLSELAGSPGFQPRRADGRVGYFYNHHQDFAKTDERDVTDRYITRWNLEKADPSLTLSPPKQPITWYIEHTTPIRYRRYVKEGISMWNAAFERVGIVGAVEVYQQDSETGAHMEKDPEDARYNFFRWNTNPAGYAIGPSRTNPLTGEILDADVVWNQGLTRALTSMLSDLSIDLSEQAFGPETLAWFEKHPSWDPRIHMAGPAEREQLERRLRVAAQAAIEETLGTPEHPWTRNCSDPTNRACRIGNQLSMDLSLAGAAIAAGIVPAKGEAELDGLPEEFMGPMIRYIAAHEVGHTLGLQHNMAASTIHTLEEINTPGFEGPTIGSVMDYAAVNINHELGEVQGPYATPEVGPYDHWAIAYGYGPKEKLDEVLAEVSKPEHVFVSQSAMSSGSDPRNMTWDLGAHNLDFCESRIALAKSLRAKLLDELVEDGDSWAEARVRFGALMGTQLQSLFTAATWIGGAYENTDHKGDPGGRAPIEDVSAADQRAALNLIVENCFEDEAFGLEPRLVRHLGKEYWWDEAGRRQLMEDANFTVHDMASRFHAIGLTLLLNPTKLRRVYDNEFRTADDPDRLTVSEVMTKVTDSVWRECGQAARATSTKGGTMCSSFRRNLQREHLDRLCDLALTERASSASLRTIGSLARHELRRILEFAMKAESTDAYSAAHFEDIRARIGATLEAAYVIER